MVLRCPVGMYLAGMFFSVVKKYFASYLTIKCILEKEKSIGRIVLRQFYLNCNCFIMLCFIGIV